MKTIQEGFRQQLKAFEIRLGETTARIVALEEAAKQPQTDCQVTAKLETRIQEIERMLTTTKISTKGGVVALFGSLESLGTEKAATEFVQKQLTEMNSPKCFHMFTNGDFKGLIWARFGSSADMLQAVEAVNSTRLPAGEKTMWANEDLPVEQRVPRAFLFGCKRLLAGWRYTRRLLVVGVESMELKINGQVVISARVDQDRLVAAYHGG